MPTTASGATNGEGAWVAAAITPAARQREAGQFLSRRMEAWRPRLILFSAQFEFRTATTLLCAATVSFRSLIPRFIPAISRGTADRNTCWRDSPFELQQNVCISACPRSRLQARFLKRRRLRCGRPFRAEALPPGRAGLRPLALPLALFAVAIRNVRCTSIVWKNSFFRVDHNLNRHRRP